MNTWKTLENADGEIVAAGYTDFTPKDGQKVREHVDADKEIIKNIKKRKRVSPIRKELLDVELKNIDDPLMKIVVQVLQERLG